MPAPVKNRDELEMDEVREMCEYSNALKDGKIKVERATYEDIPYQTQIDDT